MAKSKKTAERKPEQEFQELLAFLKEVRGLDLTGYRPSTLQRRITKRMWEVGVETLDQYRDFLEVQPDEFNELFNTILINVTSFFRDTQAWDFLDKEVIPAIAQRKGKGQTIRVWSAGCSSGEEAYSVAMLFAERFGAASLNQRLKVYATDVDQEALQQARQALFPAASLKAVPAELRARYFEQSGAKYLVKPALRRAVVFGRHDILRDAPISHVDLLVCRNLLMYFNKSTQNEIMARLHFALNEGGYLFLGKAEMLLAGMEIFRPLNLRHRIFLKESASAGAGQPLPTSPEGEAVLYRPSPILREAAFSESPMAQLVIDKDQTLVMANDQARSLFGLRSGDLSRPFRDLELSYRPVELRGPIEEAMRTGRTVNLPDIRLPSGEGMHYLDVHVAPLVDATERLTGVSVTFEDVTPRVGLQDELVRSREALETAYEELQASNEELETTNEELQSANEELETTNEELQSANEELETMNEELQSSNEELSGANLRLRGRGEEVRRSNQFLESVLSSLQQATIVVDKELRILLWNDVSEDLWGVRSDEAQGKFFLNLDIGLPVDKLKRPLQRILADDATQQTQEVRAINRRGRAIACHVSMRPLRGEDQATDGILLMIEEVKT
jgi:two-component system CheB/CheR fusion protein